MLTKVEKLLLAALVVETRKMQSTFHPADRDMLVMVLINDLKITKRPFAELQRAAQNLEASGYVQVMICDSQPWGVMLTFKGEHYKEIGRIELLEFLKKSILVPVVVALLTTLLTTGLGYLWTRSGISTAQKSQTPSSAPTMEDSTRTAVS